MFPIWVCGLIKVRDPTASNISLRILEHHRRSEESIGLESALARVGACCTHTGRAGGHASSWEAPRRVRTVADMGPATVRNHKSHSVRCNSTALTSHRALGAAALDTKESSTPPPPHKPMRALERLNLQHQLAHHTTLNGFVRCVQFQGPGPAAALDTVRTGCICQSKHLRSRGMIVLGFSCVLASLDRKPARGTAFGFCGIRIPCVSCDFTSGVMYPHDHVCRCSSLLDRAARLGHGERRWPRCRRTRRRRKTRRSPRCRSSGGILHSPASRPLIRPQVLQLSYCRSWPGRGWPRRPRLIRVALLAQRRHSGNACNMQWPGSNSG